MITNSKITTAHLMKKAVVYIRQSSMKQVRCNTESQIYQRALKEKAIELGWPDSQIEIVDTDLGITGKNTVNRIGFEEIVKDISLSRIGIVFGYEVSRLARNCADWYKLIELCSLFGTLIGDTDGIYNPSYYNDRLLLGLKGTMSEAELHILKNRLTAGRLNKAKRGELVQHIPVGYVYGKELGVIKDPDQQVQSIIALVFNKFEEKGSCRQVLKYFGNHNILIPRRSTKRENYGKLEWKQADSTSLLGILHNPIYAGAFAYGRQQKSTVESISGNPKTKQKRMPMDKWISLVKDKYPAYISWEQYLWIQQKLQTNLNQYNKNCQAKGVERDGRALCQGIIYCGECGNKLTVTYNKYFRYQCTVKPKRFAMPMCLCIHGETVNRLVEEAFFEAIKPCQLDLLEELLKKEKQERALLEKNWLQSIERVCYEEKLARKRYEQVDPENRLVANELEKCWEEKLLELNEIKQDYEDFKTKQLDINIPKEIKEKLKNISETLPGLWKKNQITNQQKKKLLRTIIDKVIVKKIAEGEIEVKIVWISEHYSVKKDLIPVRKNKNIKHYQKIKSIVIELFKKGFSDKETAEELNKKGYKNAYLKAFKPSMILRLRLQNGLFLRQQKIDKFKEKYKEAVLITEAAKMLGKDRQWIYDKIRRKKIKPKKDTKSGYYIITTKELTLLKNKC